MTFDFETIIDRKGTWCTQWDYVKDRFGVEGLLPFTISDMDFACAPVVIDALKLRLEHPVLGYSRWRHDDFKDAISHWFGSQFNTILNKQHIVYGPSVIFMVSEMIRLWSKEGEGIIVHTPSYDAFEALICANKRHFVKSELIKRAELNVCGTQYLCDFVNLEALLQDPNNTLLLLCNPHNPTGKVWSASELDRIATLCSKYNVRVISDEIHMDMVWNKAAGSIFEATHSPWSNHGKTQWCLFTSASKSFNTPALTGAYGIFSDQTSHDIYLQQLKAVYGLSSPAVLSIIAHIFAYKEGADWLGAMKKYVYDNFCYLKERLDTEFPCLNWKIPQASYLAWIDLMPIFATYSVHSVKQLAGQLQDQLIHVENIAIMLGATYGDDYAHFVRLNLACSRIKLEQGIGGLCRALKMLK